jgi:hypothetical protein
MPETVQSAARHSAFKMKPAKLSVQFDLYLVVDNMLVKDASRNGTDHLKLAVARFVGVRLQVRFSRSYIKSNSSFPFSLLTNNPEVDDPGD